MGSIRGGGGSAHSIPPLGRRAPRSMVQNMCFWEGKAKAQEVRAQEENVGFLGPGSLFVVGEKRNPVDNCLDEVGARKDMVRSSSHTFTNNITGHFPSCFHQAFKSRIHDYGIDNPLCLPKATSRCIDDPANSSTPSTGRIRYRTQALHASRLLFTASSSLTFNEQPVLTNICSYLSVVVLICDFHRAVGRYFLRVNVRYVRVHTSTSDPACQILSRYSSTR